MYSTGIFYEGNGVIIKAWMTSLPSFSIKEPFTEEEFRALEPYRINEIKERLRGQLIKNSHGDWLDEVM